ncbi:transmembrane protein 98-like [Chrysoperla carnea]|uniref:transmembrane protein 98-like n=1 Tax=Chrysoperla carnea TaxID=189513 RepID=UPI001D05F19C|nr:transmembrane protein 98-like [Chrysoperla carnea]
MSMHNIEIAVTVGALTAIFLGSFIILILICRRSKLNYKSHKCNLDKLDERPDIHLIDDERPDLELGEVRLRPDLEQILADEQWVDDATGLAPHCLAVLKICHNLTERLTAITMGPLQSERSSYEIVEIARRISLRVDDVVQSMYPPLDARLLEARAVALALAVTQLALIARYNCNPHRSYSLSWIDAGLSQMDSHLIVLREAALAHEASCRIQNYMNYTNNTRL